MSKNTNDLFDLVDFLSVVVELLTLEACARKVELLVEGEVSLEVAKEQGYRQRFE
jgi:hypothetical protein